MAQELVQKTQTEVGHEDPAFPPFNTHTFPSQLFWFVIVFIALYQLMSRVALPRVGGIFEVRRNKIGSDLDDATHMQKQAEDAGAAYEKTLADAKTKAQAVAQQTRDQLAAASENRRKELETSLNAKLAAAETQIGATRAQAMSNVSGIATEVATAIVQELTGQTVGSETMAQAVASLKPE